MKLLRTPGYRLFRGSRIPEDKAKLGAEQPIVGSEISMGISDANIKEHSRMWEKVNNKAA